MTKLDLNSKRRPDGAAFVVAALLGALGAVLIWQGGLVPDRGGYSGIASGDVLLFIGGGLILLALAHVIKGLRHTGSAVPRQQILPVLFIIGGLALQLALLKPLGFSIASGLLFACTAAAFGKRNFALTLPLGIVLALVSYGIFDRLLQLKLPAGFPETLIFGG